MSYKTHIRFMTIDDLDQVMEIENASFVAPWRKQDFLYELNDNPVNVIFVLEVEVGGKNEIAGFIDFMITFNSSTISQIAVSEHYRHHKLGTKLLNKMLEYLHTDHTEIVETITLEVRTHNKSAIAFYEKNVFEAIFIKPHYYNNGDDALYMVRRLI